MFLYMSTVDVNFFENLHEYLKAGDRYVMLAIVNNGHGHWRQCSRRGRRYD